MVEKINFEYLDGETLSKIINIVIASSKIQKLNTPYKNIRPNSHIILYGIRGTAKSTMLDEICETLKIINVKSITSASFLGSVDKLTKKFVFPIPWQYRNNVFPIDEYDYNTYSAGSNTLMELLLSASEKCNYTKSMGYSCDNITKKDGDLYCKVKKNVISVKSRFAIVMTTMMNLRATQSNKLMALMDRCIPVPFYPNMEDLLRVAEGKRLFIYKKIGVEEEIKINKTDFDIILNFTKNCENVTRETFLRTLGDLCRIFAVLNEHNMELYKLIAFYKNIKCWKKEYYPKRE